MNAFSNFLVPLLGLGYEAKDLTFVQISLRAIIVFLVILIMVRLGQKRSLARKSAFDAILLVILASFLARAINGTSPLFATIGAGFVIVLLNRLLAFVAYYSHSFGILIKGRPEIIVENGNLILSTMHRNHISKHDLEEDMHLVAHTDDLSEVRLARVERSGDISFIKK